MEGKSYQDNIGPNAARQAGFDARRLHLPPTRELSESRQSVEQKLKQLSEAGK